MEEDGTPEGDDELFGFNLRRLREKAGLSQAALAEAMRERGRPWHQSTVYRVESGRQPVPFWEARDLSAILQVSLERFTWKPADANASEYLYMCFRRVRERALAVSHEVSALLAARALAERGIEDTVKYDSPRVREAREEVGRALRKYSLDAAVGDGWRKFREMSGDGEGGEGDDEDAESEPGIVDQQRA